MTPNRRARTGGILSFLALLCGAPSASAQNPPLSSTTTDDTPSIRVGAVLFPDYTYTIDPTIADSDGNAVHLNQFNLTRGFVDVTGKISRLVSFRITPDVARETSLFSNISGSLELRIAYAYAQFNLDDWMTKDSYVRFGIHETPWLVFAEGIYRYRFQGTMFAEREGYLGFSDAGASFHYAFPSDYGDVHVGVYNGETANKTEVNNEKSLQVRGTIAPFAGQPESSVLRGLRASAFYDADNYVKNGPRNRFIGALTYEHHYLHAGFEFLTAADRTSVTKPEIDGRGYSLWATPRLSGGIEGLVRYDHLEPNDKLSSQTRSRTIVGVAYWFPHQGAVASALILDYDAQTFSNFIPAQPKQSKLAVHGLISF